MADNKLKTNKKNETNIKEKINDKKILDTDKDNYLLELQRVIGNKATEEYVKSKLNEISGSAEEYNSLDPVYFVNKMMKENYVGQHEKLKEYIPKNQGKEVKYPDKFLDFSMDKGKLVAGVMEGKGKVMLLALLQNTIGQSVNRNDSKRLDGKKASNYKLRNVNVVTSEYEKGATSIVIDTIKGAKRAVRSLQMVVEQKEHRKDSVDTFEKVLPFLNVKRDKEILSDLKEKLSELKEHYKNVDNCGDDEQLNSLKEGINIEIEYLEKKIDDVQIIINKKLQQRAVFIKKLSKSWKNINKSSKEVISFKSINSIDNLEDEEEEKEEMTEELDDNTEKDIL